MVKTRFSYIDYQRVYNDGASGELMMRLAVAVNNFMSTEHFFGETTKLRRNKETSEYGRALAMFLVAVSAGYLYESLQLIHQPKKKGPPVTLHNPGSLKRYLDRLSPAGKDDYNLLKQLVSNPENGDYAVIKDFRNVAAFHIDQGQRDGSGPLVKFGIQRLAKRRIPGVWIRPERTDQANRRDNRRFEFADKIMDVAVCRKVFGIDEHAAPEDLQNTADITTKMIITHAARFVRFASELCRGYFQDMHI